MIKFLHDINLGKREICIKKGKQDSLVNQAIQSIKLTFIIKDDGKEKTIMKLSLIDQTAWFIRLEAGRSPCRRGKVDSSDFVGMLCCNFVVTLNLM